MKNDKKITKRYCRMLALNIGIAFTSSMAFAAQGPAVFFGTSANNMLAAPLANAVPTGFNPLTGMLPAVDDVVDNKTGKRKVTVHQVKDKAIASWDTFDIGENSWVYFEQQGHTDWKALNRIYDGNPSQIFGKLTADGQVYLINQNGILFGSSSSVNVHGLVASSLDLDNDDFLNLTAGSSITFGGRANYDQANQPDWQPGNAYVYNQGFISAELIREEKGKSTVIRDGSVFLVAPEVGNSGTIVAPYGQIGLAAGQQVTLAPEPDTTYQNEKYVSQIDSPGQALNEANGALVADNGRVGMYGRVVNQRGMVRSVTSVWHRGAIELRATEKVVTGPKSTTLTPVTTSEEKTGEDFRHRPGEIYIGGIGRGIGRATGVVEHNGTIAADSGDVQIFARDRAYFGAGSVIDVSGAWSIRDGAAQWHTQEMNTAQLKDDQQQKKENSLLYRSEVTVNELFGSTIGDFSETYETDQLTSLQKAGTGGSIRVEAPEGDIIVRNGASFDISGGGYYHGESTGIGTKLLYGDRIYDLDEAPSYLPYTAFADVYAKEHERYGITETYSGLYAGGVLPLYERIPAHLEGHDAGGMTLISRSLVFDGSLAARSTIGPYQIYDADLFSGGIIEIDGRQLTERVRRPRSGALRIGGVATDGNYADHSNILGELVIKDQAEPLPADFTADSPREPDAPSYLSAATVNAAGLGALTVKANRRILVDKNADIRLAAGGELHFESRRIEHRGTIDVPAGSVTMALQHNYTNVPANPWYAEVNERLILAGASRISTAGERVDQVAALARGESPVTGIQTAGGSISLRDLTRDTIPSFEQGLIDGLGQGDGVILARGALLDVSGGYEITADSAVQAGDAGELLISGSNVILAGEVKGHGLAGAEGGGIAIFANNIRVEKEVPELSAAFGLDDPLPLLDFGHDDAGYPREQQLRQFSKGLVLADNRFARTGFSRISLNSVYDFVINDGVELAVSTTRKASPMAVTAAAADSYVDVPAVEAGSTAFTITAGGNLDGVVDFDVDYAEYADDKDFASLVLPEHGSLILPAGGAAALAAPAVTIAGDIAAPAGAITISATNGDLLVAGTADISAAGHISPVGRQVIENLAPVYEVWDAGSITLKNTSSGLLQIEEDAELDVSGTRETVVAYADLGTTANPISGAGRAGSITLSSKGELIQQGSLRARAYFPGMVNGSLTIERNSGAGYVVDDELLAIFRNNDFYQWRLAGSNSLIFDGDQQLAHDGRLILDTPLLISSNDAAVEIAAGWLQLDNTYLPTTTAPVAGNGRFALTGNAIDINGAVAVSGAATLSLAAASDLALTDHLYTVSGATGSQYYAGSLKSAADMTVKADHIYPTTFSDFTIATDKTITILPGSPASGNLLYSAAGSLTLAANRIDHQGYLAAPLGTITLTGTGENSRVMLSPDSVTSVAGQAGMVAFGELNDTGEFWTWQRKEDAGTALTENVSSAPAKHLTLEADEVIVREGAQIDLSGGGAIFAWQFLPGLEGTIDPLVKEGQYLVVPGLELPGEVIRITAGNGSGLAAGVYSLLPLDEAHAENARYAFLPGAYVLRDQGNFTGSVPARTLEGYTMVSGQTGMRGFAADTRFTRGFALRPAAEVLGEGEYATPTLTGGDGGSFTLVGRQSTVTAILEGDLQAMALADYQGGTFSAAAQAVEIGPESFGLDEDFGIGDAIPDGLQGKLNIKDTTFSGNGFSRINVGDPEITRSIVLRQDSSISAENIAFNAGSGYLQGEEKAGEIIVARGAQVHAVQPASGGGGYSEVVFTTDGAFHYDSAEEDEPVSTTLPGSITLARNSLIHAADNITLDTDNLDLQGADNLRIDHSTLTLKSSRIVFSTDGRPAGEGGLFLTDAQWQQFADIEEIRLDSATDILFAGDFSLSGRDRLMLDAQRIGGYQLDDFAAVSIAAPCITLANSKPSYDDDENRQWLPGVASLAMAESGGENFFTLLGDESITLGPGDLRIDGFRAVNLRTRGDLALTGQAYQGQDERGNDLYDPSALRVPADINISAARLRLDPMDNGAYKAADYLLSAADALRIMPAGGGESGATLSHGGRLQLQGRRLSIEKDALVDTVSATVVLSADEVNVDGAIRSVGSDDTAAGSVTIMAQNSFTLAEDGILDVSAGNQGDAGTLAIEAPHADSFSLAGTLLGSARNNGVAGAFVMDARDLSGTGGSTGFDELAGMLSAGGFFQSIDVRSRQGNITLGADKTVTAEYFKLTADGNAVTGQPDNPTGHIDIYGTVNAAGEEGGAIELYAANDLTLHSGSELLATAAAAGGRGGEVFLSTAVKSDQQSPLGYLRMHENSVIDVSGGGDGEGGGISFRSQRNTAGNDVKMELAGTVIGADSIIAEGVRLYNHTQLGITEQNAMKGHAAGYAAQVRPFSQGNAGVRGVFDNLTAENVAADAFHHRAGIEVRSNADLNVNSAWSLANWLGAGSEPVNLTLRAAGNLNINANIFDKPTSSIKRVGLLMRGNLEEDVTRPSADLNLIAGARTDSADFMAVIKDIAAPDTTGRLIIGDNRKVYTETGNIRFASASDTVIGKAAAVNPAYDPSPWKEGNLASTLASFRGNVQGFTGRDLIAKGPIQTATGDIDIRTGRDIKLYDPQDPNRNLLGAVRTTGAPVSYEVDYVNIANAGMLQFYDYCQGGSIMATSGGDIQGGVTAYGRNWDAWWRSMGKWGAAFAQTDGGTLGIAAMAGGDVRVKADGDIDTQMGTFGQGDLAVSSGSDLNGRFLAADGLAALHARGSFGSARPDQQVELMDAGLSLMAEGDIFLGTVLNPSYVRSKLTITLDEPRILMGYTTDSAVSLRAVHGDVAVSGHAGYENDDTRILPASLEITAGNDIIFSMAQLTLSPAARGRLILRAGHDILGTSYTAAGNPQPAYIRMLQSDPDNWYGMQDKDLGTEAPSQPLHTGDTVPVTVEAGNNIENIRIQAPKKTTITAGNDIRDLELIAQNIAAGDLSFVRAGGDIVMGSYERSTGSKFYSGFRFAGPGAAVVQAGGAISLGTTEGIRSVANGAETEATAWEEGVHPSLSFSGADLYVLSGIESDIAPAEVKGFFDAIRASNREISLLLADEKADQAQEVETRAREELILPLFGTAYPRVDDNGGISMTQSKIATLYGGDINILSTGDLDVGGSSFTQRNSSSGIKTEFGGGINVFSVGDVNVNESRAMTWMGGDITIWTESNINAGRGSKTAVNASGAAVPRINERAVSELFKKPSVGGSGIRAITYDPDGPNGPREMPEAGDIYLFARGAIDAGEAGIAGSSIYLAASQVVNAQNITFSQSGVGVPAQSNAAVNIGAVSGAGAIAAATSEATRNAAGLNEAREKALQNLSELNETLVPRVLKVEVIDLQENL